MLVIYMIRMNYIPSPQLQMSKKNRCQNTPNKLIPAMICKKISHPKEINAISQPTRLSSWSGFTVQDII